MAVDNGNTVTFNYTISAPISLKHGKRTEARLGVEKQSATTTWDLNAGFYTKHQQALHGVSIYTGRGKKAQHILRIGQLNYVIDSQQQAKKQASWRMPYTLRLQDVHLQQNRADWADIGSLNVTGFIDQRDPKQLITAHHKWTQARNNLAESQWKRKRSGWRSVYVKDAKAPKPDYAPVQAAVKQILNLFHDAAMNITAHNVSVGNGGDTLYTASQARIALDYRRDDQAGSNSNITLGLDDLTPHQGKVARRVGKYAQFLPHRIQLNLGAEQLPKDIGYFVGNAILERAEHHPRQRNRIMMRQLYKLLIDSPMQLVTNGSYLETDKYRIDLDGKAQLNPSAKFGATGKVELSLFDLNGFQKTLLQAGAPKRKAKQATAFLRLFSNLTKEHGKSKASFIFTIQKAGNILLNGKDISPLIKQMKKMTGMR